MHEPQSLSVGMLAYNLYAGVQPEAQAAWRHCVATARLRFLFVAAIWRHAGRTGVSYSDQEGLFELKCAAGDGDRESFAPVVEGTLR